MQFKVFHIAISGSSEAEEELNKFLRSHRIVTVQRELARTASGTFWCFCVEYLDQPVKTPATAQPFPKKGERVDYKEVLSEEDFIVFSKIRELRKELAMAETIPVYTVCTNEHLAQMVLNRCSTLSALRQISGFGEAKIQKYGERFLELLGTLFNGETNHETGGTTDASDHHG
jgi:superfamily II DNA helicase RecQ